MQSLNPLRQAQAAKSGAVLFLLGLLLPISGNAQEIFLPSQSAAAPSPEVFLVFPIDRPPAYSTRYVAGQVAIGAAAGAAAGLAGGFIGYHLEACDEHSYFLCGLGGIVLGFSAGYTLGSAGGVYFAGRTDSTAINFGRTVLGSAAGFAGAILLISAFDDGGGWLFIPLLLGPPLAAALIGNTSRHYRPGHPSSALLNVGDAGLALGVPAVQREALIGLPHTTVQSVRLLEVRW